MTRPSVAAMAMLTKNNVNVRPASGPRCASSPSCTTPPASEANTSGITTKNSMRRNTCPSGSNRFVATQRAGSRMPGTNLGQDQHQCSGDRTNRQAQQDAVGKPGIGVGRHEHPTQCAAERALCRTQAGLASAAAPRPRVPGIRSSAGRFRDRNCDACRAPCRTPRSPHRAHRFGRTRGLGPLRRSRTGAGSTTW